MFVALEAELNPLLNVPLSTEELPAVPIGAAFDYGDVSYNFVVVVPQEISNKEDRIVAAIQAKKAAGRVFKVTFV